MPLSDEDIREILRLIDESDLEELRIETEGLSLYVRRGSCGPSDSRLEPQPPAEVKAAPVTPPSDAIAADGAVAITAPMLGIFHRAAAPGAQPFVEVGARVQPDTVVCLIEVMKMMNSIPAGVSGTVVEVCAENAQLVEDETPLFRVEPDQ